MIGDTDTPTGGPSGLLERSPFLGYSQSIVHSRERMQTIFVDPDLCVACKSCEVAFAVNRSSLSKRLPEAMLESPLPLSRVRVEDTARDRGFPVQCRHCEDA